MQEETVIGSGSRHIFQGINAFRIDHAARDVIGKPGPRQRRQILFAAFFTAVGSAVGPQPPAPGKRCGRCHVRRWKLFGGGSQSPINVIAADAFFTTLGADAA